MTSGAKIRIMKARGLAVALALAAMVTACGSSSGGKTGAAASRVAGINTPPSPSPTATPSPAPDIKGTIELTSSDVVADPSDGSCTSGDGGYDDISEGAQATLTDESGTVIGTTQLEAGKQGDSATVCDFSFDFGTVTAKPKFYSVQVSHRGTITDSAAELEANDWLFELTLGDD